MLGATPYPAHMTDAGSDGIEVRLDRDTVRATAVVAAPAVEVFEFVRRPANHSIISGDHSVRGNRTGPDVLEDGDKFGMKMKLYGIPYAISSRVVELEPGRLIAWAHVGGHRWRWEMEPIDVSSCHVTETFDLRPAKLGAPLKLAGFPKRHRDNVRESVANVVAHFS